MGQKLKDVFRKNGEHGFVLEGAVPIKRMSMKNAKNKMVKHTDDKIKEIERVSGGEISKIYFGKSYIRNQREAQKKLKGTKTSTYRPLEYSSYYPKTWNLKGIRERYYQHRKKDYGKSGMVMLGIVTMDSITQQDRTNENYLTAQEYAQKLEARVIQEFDGDVRLANKNADPGKYTKNDEDGYVVYMACTLK